MLKLKSPPVPLGQAGVELQLGAGVGVGLAPGGEHLAVPALIARVGQPEAGLVHVAAAVHRVRHRGPGGRCCGHSFCCCRCCCCSAGGCGGTAPDPDDLCLHADPVVGVVLRHGPGQLRLRDLRGAEAAAPEDTHRGLGLTGHVGHGVLGNTACEIFNILAQKPTWSL